MSIASEFDSTIENIKSDYEGLENIGADLTNIDKNIYNIRTCLDNIYTNLPKTTGEGSNLSLTTLKGRINVDDILGDTEQEGTPTPSSPQDINVVTGTQEVVVQNANLFIPALTNNGSNIIQANASVTLNGDEFTFVASGTDMYFGQVTNANTNYVDTKGTLYSIEKGEKIYFLLTNTLFKQNFITFYDENKTSLGFAQIQENTGNATAPTNAKYYSIRIGNASATSGTTYTTKIMTSKAPITSYVAHQEQTKTLHLGDIELAKIGTYKNRIFETSRKNKYDSNNVIENALIQPSLNKIGATTECTTIWFKCTPNTTYTLSRDKGDRLVIGGSNTQPALNGEITTLYDIGASEDKTYTFNSGNFEYVAIYISRYNTSKPTIIMINEGSIALPYEPYGSDKWYIEKKIGHKKASEITENNIGLVSQGASFYNTGVKSDKTLQVYSNVQTWKNNTDTEWNALNGNYIGVLYNVSQIYINKTASIKSEILTWLNSINFEMYYVLATPTYEEITNETLLNELNELEKMMSYNGQTNISVSGNLPMILDVSALKGE